MRGFFACATSSSARSSRSASPFHAVLQEAADDGLELLDALKALVKAARRYSLLEGSEHVAAGGYLVSMHRLVQDVQRRRLARGGQRRRLATAAAAAAACVGQRWR